MKAKMRERFSDISRQTLWIKEGGSPSIRPSLFNESVMEKPVCPHRPISCPKHRDLVIYVWGRNFYLLFFSTTEIFPSLFLSSL